MTPINKVLILPSGTKEKILVYHWEAVCLNLINSTTICKSLKGLFLYFLSLKLCMCILMSISLNSDNRGSYVQLWLDGASDVTSQSGWESILREGYAAT